MVGTMISFDDIKSFQNQLMLSFQCHCHTERTARSNTGDLEITTPRNGGGVFKLALVRKH